MVWFISGLSSVSSYLGDFSTWIHQGDFLQNTMSSFIWFYITWLDPSFFNSFPLPKNCCLTQISDQQLQSFEAADVKQDYETGKDDTAMVTFKIDFDKADSLEDAIKASCGRDIVFFKKWNALSEFALASND